jgi:hypothetical protein
MVKSPACAGSAAIIPAIPAYKKGVSFYSLATLLSLPEFSTYTLTDLATLRPAFLAKAYELS